MSAEYITVADLATELDMSRSALIKAVRKMDLPTRQMRSLASRGQAMLAVSAADAGRIREHYAWRKT